MPYRWILIVLCGSLLLSACSAAGSLPSVLQTTSPDSQVGRETSQPAPVEATGTVPAVVTPATSATQADSSSAPSQPTPTTSPTRTPLAEDAWMSLPVLPSVSDTARAIYLRGLQMGNDPHAFSKIGDCQSITSYFLAPFDTPGQYNLGEYTSLQETIDWFAGSFSRESLSVKGGFNAAAVLSPLRADPSQCQPGESPIACELRFNNPSLALVSLEEWWAGHPENYEQYMRQVIELAISEGVLPILATKADNLEGNQLINQTIARLAWEYDIPLWNFWLAVQPIPNHGVRAVDPQGAPDNFHLTHSQDFYNFSNPQAVLSGWSVRNLTALQVLDAVRRSLPVQP